MKNKNTIMIVAVVLIIVAAIGGFVGGMMYQKSQSPFQAASAGQFAGRSFGGGNGQGFMGRGANGAAGGQRFTPVKGQILNISNNTITIKQQDGTSKIVVLGSATTFVNTQKASLPDLKTGDTVMVVGSSNSDGSITASDVQINPQQFTRPANPSQSQ